MFFEDHPVRACVLLAMLVPAMSVVEGPADQAEILSTGPLQGKKPNRLIREKSPYLLQHADNPVDWYPWGEEAFQKARNEDKPIFLSIGYSTCYWCHVMEREVFENPEIAGLMNEFFVNIKVDREERPDVDRVYMAAVQGMTGSGGWPMSLFLTPELRPFFGATYLPPVTKYGRMGFPELARNIHELWRTEREKVLQSGEQITDFLRRRSEVDSSFAPDVGMLKGARAQFGEQYDPVHGGFGGAPKFPRPVAMNFLLRYYARTGDAAAMQMTLHTLRKMAEGGMYDHLGGGFHRYSVDAQWRVPHFEKMLYDQAQLANSFLDAYQITHEPLYAATAREVLRYVQKWMTHPGGGFYSAEDAESAIDSKQPKEKAEGEFYLWKKGEIDKVLGREAGEIFCFCFGIEKEGNTLGDPHGVFGNKNVLYISHSSEEAGKKFGRSGDEVRALLEQSKKKLLAAREKRPRPHLDDKILTSWNGLMISAFARAYQVLGDPAFLMSADRAADFILENLYDRSGKRLFHRYRDGEARVDGQLEDYAFLVAGLLDLYEASFDISRLERAIDLTTRQVDIFYDKDEGGFWDTPGNDRSILVRTKEDYDGAEPTGNSIAVLNILRIVQITGNEDWGGVAEKTLRYFGKRLQTIPHAMPQMLVAVGFHLTKPKQVIIAGRPGAQDTQALLRQVHGSYVPNKILLLADGGEGQKRLASFAPFLGSIVMRDGKATAYVCEDYVCKLPTTDARELSRQVRASTKVD